MTPFISIVIPTYNRASVLERAIRSVLLQQFQNWELFIVDDGSTDNTKQVVEPYLVDSRIRYDILTNGGAPRARNYGLSKATGEWIIFLDSDDEFLPGYLNFFTENLSEEFKIYYCRHNRINRSSISYFDPPDKLHKEQFIHGNPIGGFSCMIFYTDIVRKAGGHDVDLPARQDADLYYRLLAHTSFKKMNIVGCNIYTNSDGRISGNKKKRFNGWLLFYKKYAKKLPIKDRFLIAKRVLGMAFLSRSIKGMLDVLFFFF